MQTFENVIVRRPCHAMLNGITTSPELGTVDYDNALRQHDSYIEALKKTGVAVTVLEADERYPDSCFVEDPAIITPYCAIITNPGTTSRNGEKDEIIGAIKKFFPDDKIFYIHAPATMEGGDVMLIDDTYYVGISRRTNVDGFVQFRAIVEQFGMKAIAVPVTDILHLKTGVVYVSDGHMLIGGEFKTRPEFDKFDKFEVPDEEAYGANVIFMNGKVIVAEGYPTVLAKLKEWGYETVVTDTSEYKKIEGGLTCLSLRF